MKTYYLLFSLIFPCLAFPQSTFDYQVQLTAKTIPNLPGIHSYAFGQSAGKWLIIGGRLDGVHARQPFSAFPSASNNTNIYVIDIATEQFWSASLNSLSTPIKEQLQSTNMNFYQDDNTLYIIGGYAFSATANNHITFNKMTSVDVPNLIDAIISASSIDPYFKQMTNENFANTGGQLGKIGTDFYLVGGQRFDGRYNPGGNPTYVQTYADGVKKFTIDNSLNQLSIGNYESTTDALHLRRRDYNLVPQVFPDGSQGYTVSSGVFQISANLPFLYPVDIKSTGHFPQTNFNQYLSNYHSGRIGLYDGTNNRMHSLFFGGISQYFYNGTTLVQDANVPFVKTISRVTRSADGTLTEFQLPIEMPSYKGTGAELILNKNLAHYDNEVIKLNEISQDEFIIGHIFGGIQSQSQNPFTNNQSATTSADNIIYEVKLIKNVDLSSYQINGENPFSFKVFPNPSSNGNLKIEFNLSYLVPINYFVTTLDGKIIQNGKISDCKEGRNLHNLKIETTSNQTVILSLIFDNKFNYSQKIIFK